jgi:hypothetical protein
MAFLPHVIIMMASDHYIYGKSLKGGTVMLGTGMC